MAVNLTELVQHIQEERKWMIAFLFLVVGSTGVFPLQTPAVSKTLHCQG